MQEDYLHYIWQHKKFNLLDLKTTDGEPVQIISAGQHNHHAGPDFFTAHIRIAGQLWIGNIEIHIHSADWFLHNHETNPAYDNVILHVVWEHDTDVFRKDQTKIPTLELKHYVDSQSIENYRSLFSRGQRWIPCENDFARIDSFTMKHWLERLYFERLERKSKAIGKLLEASKNDWETVLFRLLARNFGLKVNGDAFASLANSFDFSLIRKLQSHHHSLEALLFGQSGLLEKTIEEGYYKALQSEYQYLKQKFNLNTGGVTPVQFFRLRPANFPTIRLSQFASLYHKHSNLFSKIIETSESKEIYKIFSVGVSAFWESHYTFEKRSKSVQKMLSGRFIDLLLINTVIPVKFSYDRYLGNFDEKPVFSLIETIASEQNAIVNKFNSLKSVTENALQSQALIELKTRYCDLNKCLQCAVGNKILS